jgi:cytochrome o ubiquinol oxidase subunit II
VIIWSIPALVIMFLGGVAWISSHELEPSRPRGAQELEVDVVALDWRWLFIYPQQGVATLNQLTIPAGQPVHFRLTSATVMNSFFIPQLGSQIYTMPGMTTQLHLQSDQPGTYEGLSAQFSGDGFADMRFAVAAVTVEEFSRWVQTTKAAGDRLDAAAYARLARPSRVAAASSYGSVDPRLFEVVASGHNTAHAGGQER